MTPIDLRHIHAVTDPELRGKTLSTGEANLSRVRRETLESMEKNPEWGFFHTEVIDEIAAGRLRALLGLESLEGQPSDIIRRVSPGGWTLQQWKNEIFKILQEESYVVEKVLLCGSAAQYVANSRILVRGLSLLACNRVIKPGELYEELDRRIRRISQGYQDVDINIEVNRPLKFSLREALNQLPCPAGVTIQVKGPKHFFIISIKDDKTGDSLDFSIYQDRDNPYLITADSLRVLIPADPGKGNLVIYDCPNIWKFWIAQVLRLADRPPEMLTDHYILPRLIDLETRKHRVTKWKLEEHAFQNWWKWILSEGPHVFFDRLKTLFQDHEPSPLGRQCQLLRWGQILREHQVEKLGQYFDKLKLLNCPGQPFLYECLHLIKHGGLLILELAGFVALQEGWKEPFSARVEYHEEKPMLRLRFRQGEIKRSLLIRYDPEKTLSELKAGRFDWQKLTAALHLLWQTPIRRRDQTEGFHKDRWLREELSGQIRSYFLTLVGTSPAHCKFTLASQSSLAAMIFPDLHDFISLEALANQLIEEKAGSDGERLDLCWKIVAKLCKQENYITAASIVIKLREKEWNYPEGYVHLLCYLLQHHPKAPRELLQACAPIGLTLSEGQPIVESADHPKVDPQDFWKLVQELKVSPKTVSPDMLLGLQDVAPQQLWSSWVISKWKKDLEHPALCLAVSKQICEYAKGGIRLPFMQDRKWFFSFIQDTKRFKTSDEERLIFFERLAASGISLTEQEKLLRSWNFNNEKAWNYIVQGYLQGNNYQSSREEWNNVLSYMDPDKAEMLLDGPLKGLEPPGGFEAFTAAILSRWALVQAKASFLEKLIPDAPWERLCNEKLVEQVLFKLLNAGHFLLGSHLLLSIKPDTVNCEFVYRAWAACLQKKVEMIHHPIILSCVRLNPGKIWERCLASLPEEIVWPIVAHIDLNPELITVGKLTALLRAALNKDPSGNSARGIQERYGNDKYKKEEYLKVLRELAAAQLVNPNGDIHFAIDIFWKTDPTDLMQSFPSEDRLNLLLRLNCVDWVVRILEKAPQDYLSSLNQKFFIKLITVHLNGKSEFRARVLLHPPQDAQFLSSVWEDLIDKRNIEMTSRSRLLMQHRTFGVVEEKVGELASRLVDNARLARSELIPDLSAFLYDLLPRLSWNRAHALWNALRQTMKASKSELFKAAMSLWETGQLPDGTLHWMMDNLNQERFKILEQQLFGRLSETLPVVQLERYILPCLIRMKSWECYWFILKKRPELPLPLPADNVPYNELILERSQSFIHARPFESLAMVASLQLHYNLGFADEIYQKLDALPKEMINDPLYITLLLLSLRPPNNREAVLQIIIDKGCPIPLQMAIMRPFLYRTELSRGLQLLVDSCNDCHGRRELLIRMRLEKIQHQEKITADEVEELALLFHRYYALAVPGKEISMPPDSPIQTIYALYKKLSANEQKRLFKSLFNLALVIPYTVQNTAVDYKLLRDLALDLNVDQASSLLAYRYLIKTFVSLEGVYTVEEKDRVILDHHGNRMRGEGSVPMDVQRLMYQAVEICDNASIQKRGVTTVLVRARMGLGAWEGIQLRKKYDLWIRSARRFLQDQIEILDSQRFDNVPLWLKDFLAYINGEWDEEEALSLSRLARLAWLKKRHEVPVMENLSELLILIPKEKCSKKAITEACIDFLEVYPNNVGNLLDVLIENNFFPSNDEKFNKTILDLIHEILSKHAQRPLLVNDLQQANLLFHGTRTPSTHHAHQLMLLESKEKLSYDQILLTWEICIKQKAHRYLLQRLVHLTKKFFDEQDQPCSLSENFLRMIPREFFSFVLELNGSWDMPFDSSCQLIKEVVEPLKQNYYIVSIAHRMFKENKLNSEELPQVIPMMPDWTWERCNRRVNKSYCGPLGPLTAEPIDALIETFRFIIEVFKNNPRNIEDCIYCLNSLKASISDTTMTPGVYKIVLVQLMEVTLKQILVNPKGFSRIFLPVIMGFIQELIESVNSFYSLNEENFITFCFLIAIEENWDRLSFIDCKAVHDHPVYRLMTGQELKSEDTLKNTLSRLRQNKKTDGLFPHLIELLELFIKDLFAGKYRPPAKNKEIQQSSADLNQLMEHNDGTKALKLWRELHQNGRLDGWNNHWNLFFLSNNSDYGCFRSLAEICCLIPLKEEQIELWIKYAPILIPGIGNLPLVKKMLRIFIEMKRPVPSSLLPLFINIHDPYELQEPDMQAAFSGSAWKEFYPQLVGRYLVAANFVSLGYLWEGWMKYREYGGDPDGEGITKRLIARSLVGDLAIQESVFNRLICWVYRERQTQLYGHLPFLFLANKLNSHVLNAWEQVVEDETAEVKGWGEVSENNRRRVSLLVEEHMCRGLRLINISRKRGWINLSTCEIILSAINTNSKRIGTVLDQLMEDAVDPAKREQTEEMLNNLIELFMAIKERVPHDVLSFVNKMFCDRADPSATEWIYQRFTDLLVILLYDVAAIDPKIKSIDEAIYIMSKHVVRQLTKYAATSSFYFLSEAFRNRGALTAIRERLTCWDKDSSVPDVVLRTQMIWETLNHVHRGLIPTGNLEKKKSHHLISIWGSILQWLRRIHHIGDSSQFIECWENAVRTCIKGHLKKEKRQELLDIALFEIACFIVKSKDNLNEVIKSLQELKGGKSEMQELCKELKKVVEDHLKMLGDTNLLQLYHRKI